MICPHCGHAIVEDQLLLAPEIPATPKVRNSDPDTSRLAMLRNRPRAGSQRAQLLDAFLNARETGLTAAEASTVTGIPYVSASTRLSELKAGEHIVPAGFTRLTDNGGEAEVLIAVAFLARPSTSVAA